MSSRQQDKCSQSEKLIQILVLSMGNYWADKYGDRNWGKGQPLSRYMDSAMRHMVRFMMGDRSEDHLSAARWNLHGLIHTQEMIDRKLLPKELDDLVGL